MASPRRGGQARLAARLAVALAAVAGARALLLQRSRPLSSYAALRSVAGAGAATRRGPREPRGPRAAVRMSSTPPGLRRVVVTGMGITSCLGNTVEDVKDSLYNARSGLEYNPKYAEMGLRSQVCGRPNISDDEINKRINRKALRFMGDNAKFAFLSMQDAIASSGLTEEQYQGPRTAGILGQGGTSLIDVTEAVDAVFKGAEGLKPGGVNKLMGVGPYRVTKTMGSTVSAVLSTMFKLQGPSYSISSACSTGAHCIGTGMEQIQLGKSDIVFAGAGEAECWQFTAMFDAMGALSTSVRVGGSQGRVWEGDDGHDVHGCCSSNSDGGGGSKNTHAVDEGCRKKNPRHVTTCLTRPCLAVPPRASTLVFHRPTEAKACHSTLSLSSFLSRSLSLSVP